MTFRILKSHVDALGYDFPAAVAAHIAALEAQRFNGQTAPRHDANVEAAVKRVQYPIEAKKPDDFVADFEIIDDTPPPPTLEDRKHAAISALRHEEQAEIEAVLGPVETRRLRGIHLNMAQRRAHKARSDATQRAVDEAKGKGAELTHADAVRIATAAVDPADAALIADAESLQARLDEIALQFAMREAALADMT
jgi:hypothetical protein